MTISSSGHDSGYWTQEVPKSLGLDDSEQSSELSSSSEGLVEERASIRAAALFPSHSSRAEEEWYPVPPPKKFSIEKSVLQKKKLPVVFDNNTNLNNEITKAVLAAQKQPNIQEENRQELQDRLLQTLPNPLPLDLLSDKKVEKLDPQKKMKEELAKKEVWVKVAITVGLVVAMVLGVGLIASGIAALFTPAAPVASPPLIGFGAFFTLGAGGMLYALWKKEKEEDVLPPETLPVEQRNGYDSQDKGVEFSPSISVEGEEAV